MRAFVITGPGAGAVTDVPEPVAEPGQVVVEVDRVGVCGTDMEFYRGDMAYLVTGDASFPIRIGHEWCGRVVAVGTERDAFWIGRRVTGDTMLGCRACRLCLSGRQHLCRDRHEIGIRHGWPGALAERLTVPTTALVALPEDMDPALGALVEPGGNALRSVRGANLRAGNSVLIIGAGTIGLLVAQIAQAEGADVHIVGRSERSLEFARSLGFGHATTLEGLDRTHAFQAVVDASNSKDSPPLALDLVEPGGRIVLVGIAGEPSLIDTRDVALADVTMVGVLSASGGLEETADLYATGVVDPRPLVAATVGLDATAAILAGERPPGAGPGPKFHIDPRR
ncbi:alcohol dehydrogenase catalytic domain-containing protein [Demequina sp. TTPB684]|uniref:zinc-dependent alcohol dehydrogenase n=1 Tax=unclassified Demequina TaxID=2620311 RepID=UPI001CF58F2A|nr:MULTISPECIES: alcohol dehydrogenase catalytic domain-containing protein [unclassified Demequina]MCB2413135.1 alcohol dehydrogenase catalytic domain-containing protein [Demequina sp. TTPB684]UPU87505.1 alcohol dehydrogenase catalytic domain-containing protein [Demequina sp. TMPB413]